MWLLTLNKLTPYGLGPYAGANLHLHSPGQTHITPQEHGHGAIPLRRMSIYTQLSLVCIFPTPEA